MTKLARSAKSTRPPRVVIVGGGFAGLAAARSLRRAPVEVVLVDRQNHHLFQPLLYQVATAALDPSDVAVPLRSILRRQDNAVVVLGEATGVDLAARTLALSDGALAYDYLVVATGATHSYFGRDDWARHAPGLKTLDDALEIRRRVLGAFEQAEREPEPARRAAWTTFVVVGGGPTGVELAGALAEVSRHTLAGEFRVIDPARARILLVEGLPRVLPTYDESLSRRAEADLRERGVEVRTGARVTAVDATGVEIGDERLAARTVLWGAGVAASALARSLGAPLDKAGRVRVEPDLSLPGRPEVLVIGDLAAVEVDGAPVPGVAPAALQQGRHAAAGIVRSLAGEPPLPFRYRDKGSFATIGRRAAVGEIGRHRLDGTAAWLAWLAIHLVFLVGFRNRVSVVLGWAYSYLTFRRPSRLITGRLAPRDAPALGDAWQQEVDRLLATPRGVADRGLAGTVGGEVLGAALVGGGIVGALDGLLLGALLGWHHVLGASPRDDATYALAMSGLAALGALALGATGRRRGGAARAGGEQAESAMRGGLLVGSGLYLVLEGLVAHALLGLHGGTGDLAGVLLPTLGALLVLFGVRLLWPRGPKRPGELAELGA